MKSENKQNTTYPYLFYIFSFKSTIFLDKSMEYVENINWLCFLKYKIFKTIIIINKFNILIHFFNINRIEWSNILNARSNSKYSVTKKKKSKYSSSQLNWCVWFSHMCHKVIDNRATPEVPHMCHNFIGEYLLLGSKGATVIKDKVPSIQIYPFRP